MSDMPISTELVKFIISVTRMSNQEKVDLLMSLLENHPEEIKNFVDEKKLIAKLSGGGGFYDYRFRIFENQILAHKGLTQDQYDTMVAYTNNGNKVMAIKYLRSITGLGLKEAKDVVEDVNYHLMRVI